MLTHPSRTLERLKRRAGDASAEVDLGVRQGQGEGVRKSRPRANALNEASAAQGNA